MVISFEPYYQRLPNQATRIPHPPISPTFFFARRRLFGIVE